MGRLTEDKAKTTRDPVLDEILFLQLDFVKKEMIGSVKSTINADNKIDCAILLSTYTEIFGGYVTGNLTDKDITRDNYDAFLPYLGMEYVQLDEKFNKSPKGLYGRVRNLLIHQGRIKGASFIYLSKNTHPSIGITYDSLGHISFNLREYFRDFKKGIEKYEQGLKNSDFHDELYQRFLSASKYDTSVDYDEHNEIMEAIGDTSFDNE